jgi:hypothetical protein
MDAVANRLEISLAQSWYHHEVDTGGHFQEPRDPGGRHQRRDSDLEDGDAVREGRRHCLERRAKRGLRQLAGNE